MEAPGDRWSVQDVVERDYGEARVRIASRRGERHHDTMSFFPFEKYALAVALLSHHRKGLRFLCCRYRPGNRNSCEHKLAIVECTEKEEKAQKKTNRKDEEMHPI